MKSKYECFLFDLDGTLLDTLDDLHAAVNYALGVCGKPLRTREEVRRFIGNGVAKLMERALGEGADEALHGRALAIFKEYYGVHCKQQTAPYPYIMELLAALKAAGKKVGVVSNKAAFATEILCKEYFGDLVGVAIGENEAAGIQKKPAPDTVFAAMKALGAAAETAVYIGDSEVDLQTAANAGIPCISVAWGMKDEEFLLRHGASVIVKRAEELLEWM